MARRLSRQDSAAQKFQGADVFLDKLKSDFDYKLFQIVDNTKRRLDSDERSFELSKKVAKFLTNSLRDFAEVPGTASSSRTSSRTRSSWEGDSCPSTPRVHSPDPLTLEVPNITSYGSIPSTPKSPHPGRTRTAASSRNASRQRSKHTVHDVMDVLKQDFDERLLQIMERTKNRLVRSARIPQLYKKLVDFLTNSLQDFDETITITGTSPPHEPYSRGLLRVPNVDSLPGGSTLTPATAKTRRANKGGSSSRTRRASRSRLTNHGLQKMTPANRSVASDSDTSSSLCVRGSPKSFERRGKNPKSGVALPEINTTHNLKSIASFRISCNEDKDKPVIADIKLLPDGLFVVADVQNQSITLFNSLGKELDSHELSHPWSSVALAVMSDIPKDVWKVAVSTINSKKIVILEVKELTLKQESIINTAGNVVNMTAVDEKTLAVTYLREPGISLVHTENSHLCHLSKSDFLQPISMVALGDKHLMAIGKKGTIARINLSDGFVVENKEVKELQRPRRIILLQSGRFIILDKGTQSLHLLASDSRWIKELWQLPDDEGTMPKWWGVTVFGDRCLIWTDTGTIFLFSLALR